MDILHLVDRLEELFNNGRPIPFTRSVIVDEERMLDIIDQMRVTIPEEMRKAQQIITQQKRILAQAEEKANRTVALAQEESNRLLEKNAVAQAAKAQADEIISKAHADSEKIRREADRYALETLSRLEYQLEQLLNQARNGIMALQSIIEPTEAPEYNPSPQVHEEPKAFSD